MFMQVAFGPQATGSPALLHVIVVAVTHMDGAITVLIIYYCNDFQ